MCSSDLDAVYKAITAAVKVQNDLKEFSVKSITETTEAQGEVTIRIQVEGRTYTGRGVSTDIIVASAKAYLNAINRKLADQADRQVVSLSGTP